LSNAGGVEYTNTQVRQAEPVAAVVQERKPVTSPFKIVDGENPGRKIGAEIRGCRRSAVGGNAKAVWLRVV